MRPSPLKYTHNPVTMMQPPSTCTLPNTTMNNNITASTSSLVDALALFAKSNVMPSAAAGAGATTTGGSSDADRYNGVGMGGFNPFDDFDAPAEGERLNSGGGAHGFFSSFAAGDKYGRH
uniref:Uncharacterized protein n=1 Tax=Arundo donax TaxID=35708 RepID=A0A0A9FGP0_ARUDO